jgi:KTSC domain
MITSLKRKAAIFCMTIPMIHLCYRCALIVQKMTTIPVWRIATRKAMKLKTNCIFRFLCIVLLNISTIANAESVFVKYQGVVDLSGFECTLTESSFVHKICYQAENRYLVVLLGSTYYHYCRMSKDIYEQWMRSDSKGTFYNTTVRGKFDCRLGGIPEDPRGSTVFK